MLVCVSKRNNLSSCRYVMSFEANLYSEPLFAILDLNFEFFEYFLLFEGLGTVFGMPWNQWIANSVGTVNHFHATKKRLRWERRVQRAVARVFAPAKYAEIQQTYKGNGFKTLILEPHTGVKLTPVWDTVAIGDATILTWPHGHPLSMHLLSTFEFSDWVCCLLGYMKGQVHVNYFWNKLIIILKIIK